MGEQPEEDGTGEEVAENNKNTIVVRGVVDEGPVEVAIRVVLPTGMVQQPLKQYFQ